MNFLTEIPKNISKKGIFKQRGSWVVLALLISAFGPYIPKAHGLRLEHIIIYGLASVLILSWNGKRNKSDNGQKGAIAGFMMAALLWTGFATILAGNSFNGKVLAGIENYLQPAAILFVFIVLKWDRIIAKRLLNLTTVTICILLTLNSIVALAAIFFDTWPLVQYFIGDVSIYEGWSVWGNSVKMGRYPGIFNQPFESGLAHSLGLLSWVYMTASDKRLKPVRLLLFVGVFTGGILSVSKVFLMGGIPLFIIYWFKVNRRSVVSYLGLIIIVLSMGAGLSWLAPNWIGFDLLSGYFNLAMVEENQGLLNFYSAERFGKKDSFIIYNIKKTLQQAPLQGFGFGSWGDNPVDNAYLEFIYQGGVVAFIFYLSILVVIALSVRTGLRNRIPEGKLLALLFVLIIGAGFGAPVLTINRASIILWILLILSMSLCEWINVGDRKVRRAL